MPPEVAAGASFLIANMLNEKGGSTLQFTGRHTCRKWWAESQLQFPNLALSPAYASSDSQSVPVCVSGSARLCACG